MSTAQAVKSWKPAQGAPGNDEKLLLYANFKQAQQGDCNTSRPGMFDPVGGAKWDAWNRLKGTSKAEARRSYVAEVRRQQQVYGTAKV